MKKLTFWETFLFILSVYVVIELYLSSLINYSDQMQKILLIVDTVICAFFLSDFFYGYYKAVNRVKFVKSNWVDLISSIPMVGFLRLGRIVKIIRVLRILRSGKFIFNIFNRNNSLRSLRNLSFIIFCLIMLFSVSIYQLEKEVNPSLDTLSESFWWTLNSTISFNYYHDIAPESIEGRVFALMLILMGMVLFGTFISFITDYFVSEEVVNEDVKTLNAKIDALNQKIEQILKNQSEKL